MPLQNRVDPFGQIHAVVSRGLFTGNRGVIHDPDTRTLLKRRWTTKAWIICDCGFKGRKREVFGRNARSGSAGWTNLFFLDEVTALTAGHRPCFECRRIEAKAFAAAFADVAGHRVSARAMDEVLHSQRLAAGNAPAAIDLSDIGTLPDGAMVDIAGSVYALSEDSALPWSFSGYGPPLNPRSLSGAAHLITPPVIIEVLRVGYQPVWATSAPTAE